MNTFLWITVWVLLVAGLILTGRIKSLHRYYARKMDFLADDAIAVRDLLTEARKDLIKYNRVHDTDTVMIERLLKELEQKQEAIVELQAKLGQHRTLAGHACQNLKDWKVDIRVATSEISSKYINRALDSLQQLLAYKI